MGSLTYNRRKGADFQRKVCSFLNDRGWGVSVAPDRGKNDTGDIDNFPFVLQCKRTSAENLGRAMDDARKQAKRAGRRFHAVIRHRLNHKVDDAYVTVSLETFEFLVYNLTVAAFGSLKVDASSLDGVGDDDLQVQKEAGGH